VFAAHAAIAAQSPGSSLPRHPAPGPFPRAQIVDPIDEVHALAGSAVLWGGLGETVPRLTIATAVDPVAPAMIEGDLADCLPVRARLESAALMAFAVVRWSELAVFALAG
jgi:hypothetical protein